jgi:hypothetical protein
VAPHDVDNLKRLHLEQNQLPVRRADQNVGGRNKRTRGAGTIDVGWEASLANLNIKLRRATRGEEGVCVS